MIEDFENELKKKKITNEEEYQIYEKLYDINFEYTILGIHYERNEYFVKIGTYNDFIENYKIKKEEYFGYKTFYIPEKYFDFYNGGHEYSILGIYSPLNPLTVQHL